MYNKKKKLLLLYSLVTIFYFINLLVCYAGEHGVTHWFWYQFITVMLVNMKYPKKKIKLLEFKKYIFFCSRDIFSLKISALTCSTSISNILYKPCIFLFNNILTKATTS
jgi:hypothetical protein